MLKSLARYERVNGAWSRERECHCGLKRVVCKVIYCLADESVRFHVPFPHLTCHDVHALPNKVPRIIFLSMLSSETPENTSPPLVIA